MEHYMFLIRGVAVWFIIIFAEMVHGILRGLFFVPVFGDFTSRQIGVFTGSLIIFAIAYFTVRWIGAKRMWQLISVGLMWMVFTVIFEISFGIFVMHFSHERILSDFNILRGGFLSLGIIFMAIAPLMAAKIRKIL